MLTLSLQACHPNKMDPNSVITATLHPNIWPKITSKVKQDAVMEQKIADLVANMTTEQKVAQMIQPEIRNFTTEDMRKYGFGSYLNGGGAFPDNNKHASMGDWASLAEEMYQASIDASQDGSAIPTMWGTDAVHGHNNVIGATIYPHNIGLGAMHNPQLVEKIGAATAKIVRVTGIDWVFAPTVAVVRDDRWGRTYEGYSEDPSIVMQYASAMVRGIQGDAGDNFLGDGKVIATAKHFLGDGGTEKGIDQGDNLTSEQDFIALHAQGYVTAIEQGVQTIMASFNSWHGEKMHGNKVLLNDILKDQMGFDGLVVGDWDGHGQITGCSNSSCAQAINAGVDIIMVPTNWKEMFENTVAQVQKGSISIERLNDAVTRILRVKMRSHLFDGKSPLQREFAGQQALLGAAEHRALARQAVRESLVLLKNKQQLLPLSGKQHYLVAGSGANNIGKQSGGWTISWQGTGNLNSDFPGASSIYDGIKQTVNEAGGKVELNEQGQYTQKPDIAIVVFGENPYAEGAGDITGIEYQQGNKRDLAMLKRLKNDGIKVVSIFLSGRPLWVNAELNASNAFVAAWLPGSEGAGIADVLFTQANGSLHFDFSGKLSYSWPISDDQLLLNVGDKNYQPLFPFGFGLSYQQNDTLGDELNEVALTKTDVDLNAPLKLFASVAQADLNVFLGDKASWMVPVATSVVTTQGSDNLTLRTMNKAVQEDARQLIWKGGSIALAYLGWIEPKPLGQYLTNHSALQFAVKVEQRPSQALNLDMHCGSSCRGGVTLNDTLATLPLDSWQTISVDLQCFVQQGVDFSQITAPFVLATSGTARLAFADVMLVPKSATSALIKCP